MIDIRELKAELQGLQNIENPDNRLMAAHRLHSKMQDVERELAMDTSMGFYDVHKLKAIVPKLLATISRLRAAARKRAERLAERGQ